MAGNYVAGAIRGLVCFQVSGILTGSADGKHGGAKKQRDKIGFSAGTFNFSKYGGKYFDITEQDRF